MQQLCHLKARREMSMRNATEKPPNWKQMLALSFIGPACIDPKFSHAHPYLGQLQKYATKGPKIPLPFLQTLTLLSIEGDYGKLSKCAIMTIPVLRSFRYWKFSFTEFVKRHPTI